MYRVIGQLLFLIASEAADVTCLDQSKWLSFIGSFRDIWIRNTDSRKCVRVGFGFLLANWIGSFDMDWPELTRIGPQWTHKRGHTSQTQSTTDNCNVRIWKLFWTWQQCFFNIHREPHQVMGNVVNLCQSRAVRVNKIAYIATTSWNLGVDEMIIFDKHSKYRARYHEMKKISIKMTRNDHRPSGYRPAHFSLDPARPLYCCESPDWVEKMSPNWYWLTKLYI